MLQALVSFIHENQNVCVNIAADLVLGLWKRTSDRRTIISNARAPSWVGVLEGDVPIPFSNFV